MKSCSFITSKVSNQFCISVRRGAHLFLSLIAVISISFAGNGFAQSCSGGLTTISSPQDIQSLTQSDSCLVVTPSGSIVPSTPTTQLISVYSYLRPTGVSITNNGALSYALTFNNTSLYGIDNMRGEISSVVNTGVISVTLTEDSTQAAAIHNQDTITSLTNTGSLQANATGVNAVSYGIFNTGTIGTITNTGTISGDFAGIFQDQTSEIGNVNNSGIIAGNVGIINSLSTIGTITNNSGGWIRGSLDYGIGNIITFDSGGTPVGTATINLITNKSGAQISADSFGIYNESIIGSITNAGLISATGSGQTTAAILNAHSGSIDIIINTGTISGGSYGIGNDGTSGSPVINTIINDTGGVITGNLAGIGNSGTIYTLNNAQGNLTYSGNLPQNYGIILGSNSSTFGRLLVSNAAAWDSDISSGGGKTTFGIYSGSVKSTKYTAVISGVTASLLTSSSLTGTYSSGGKSYAYSLALESGSSTIWDLLFPTYVEYTGPSVANTNQSLVNTAQALQGTYTLQNSVLANSFSYDCTVFGANDMCVSAGGRNTQVQAANGLNNTSALLIAAYRPHPNYRIGAYADQNLSVSNPGGTVNLGNNTPLIGLFAAWNERLDGTGTEVKVSAAYGQKNTTITRSVVGSGDGASEAGSGSSKLNSQGAQVTAKYGFSVLPEVIVSPYVGVRYTQNNMGGYTESTSSSVTAPLTYNALNTNATTALAGVGASYRVIPAVMTFASAGVETDTNTANGTYSATNSSIGTLTPVNFNANPVRTRPTATVGAYYDIEKNQRLGVTGIYRQEAYQAVSTTTVLATYTIGL
ncbi:autotransporter outer membrane beta-barrel domain-containing protein [Polynucleobacter paneuropaeus]|nr:autotransporter outer membrane beta-barrel domain-containing protein [Polynucleobacter paneuropaeus]